MPYDMPSELREAIKAFIEYYNYRRYHEGLGDVTPYDVYIGTHVEIIQGRKEAKSKTLLERRDYNKAAREQGNKLRVSLNSTTRTVPLSLTIYTTICIFFYLFADMNLVAFSPAMRPELRAKPSICPVSS